MVNIKKISFSYGEKKIIEDFSYEIKSSDRICLFGESGRGKTTLMRLIMGLEKPQSGEIITEKNMKLSAVFQENRLLPFKTVLQNITVIGVDSQTALKQLEALGIVDAADKYPRELSGGMKRRAAIARALSVDYDLILLDEPFAGLDSANTVSAAKHISESIGDRALVLITHSEEEARLLGAETVRL